MARRLERGAAGAASLVLCLLSLCILASTHAAHAVSQARKQSEADDLVRLIEARYGHMRGLAADFEQVYSAGSGLRARRERGRLFLARPRRMRWEYDPEPGKLFIVNEREVWLYVPADREATHALDRARISDARFPFLFLLGSSNLRRLFRSITLVETGGAPSDLRTLRLVPRGNASGLREIFLEVFRDGKISKLRLVDEAGAVSEISLSNVRENWLAPADAFEFRPPPGVTVRMLN